MPYYHIKLTDGASGNSQRKTEYELNLSEEELKTFVEQYDTGDFLFNGKWIKSSSLEIEIRETPYVTTYVHPSLNPFTIFGTTSIFPNITRKFIKSPPKGQPVMIEKAPRQLSKDIFIVHGTDIAPVKELKAIIEEVGLNPIVLHEQPSRGMTIIEKLEKYSNVGFAFIILTPDDLGVGKKEAQRLLISAIGKENVTVDDVKKWYSEESVTVPITILKMFEMFRDRARQNVVLEFGYFMGLLHRDRVCCLYKGDIELPSDTHGIVYLPFKESVNETKGMILKELREAGYEIKE